MAADSITPKTKAQRMSVVKALWEFLPSLESNGKHEVKRNELGASGRDFQIAFELNGQYPQHEKEQAWIAKVAE